MKLFKLILVSIILAVIISACATEHSKIIVAEFGDHPIYMNEFEKAYQKNDNKDTTATVDTMQSLKKFLDLYVDYRMKLRDAIVRGYDQDPDIQKEINNYKEQIGETLFLENALYEPAIKQLYERRKWEIRVSHILITKDSTRTERQAYQLAKSLIDSIKHGASLEELCKKYSADRNTREKGGDAYYVTAGVIFSPELEDAIYNTPLGQVYPQPVQTRYGFHIIKVTDKQKRIPEIRASHIMASLRDSTGKVDTVAALKKIEAIQDSINHGADFAEMAKKYSDDKSSGKNGGDLGFFQRGRMVRPFDEAVFKLKVGEVSPIVRTPFGYHLIKVTDIKKYPTYKDDRLELKKMFQRTRYREAYPQLMDSLKKEFNYHLDANAEKNILSNFDSLGADSSYDSSAFKKNYGRTVLLKVNNQDYNLDSLMNYMATQRLIHGKKMNKKRLDDAITKYSYVILLREKALEYDKENPEFAQLMKDYKDGAYLFKTLEDEVWHKITVDSEKVLQLYNETKNNYWTSDSVKYSFVAAANDSTIQNYYNLVKSGYPFDSLVVNYTKRGLKPPERSVPAEKDIMAKTAFSLKNPGDISQPFHSKEGWFIVKLIAKENKRLKTFEEARPEVSSLYQEKESKRLEKKYLDRLRSIYHPKIYYNELKYAFKKD